MLWDVSKMVNVYMSKMNLVVKTVKLMLCFVNMLSVSSCMLSCLIKAFNKGMSNLLLINSQCQTLQINCVAVRLIAGLLNCYDNIPMLSRLDTRIYLFVLV